MKRIFAWSFAIVAAIAWTGVDTAAATDWGHTDWRHFDPWGSPRRLDHRRSFVEDEPHAGVDFTMLGGVQSLRRNAPAIPDNVYSVPTTAMIGLQLNPSFALEGEFTLSAPVLQKMKIADNEVVERKGPDLLLYQAGVRVVAPGETHLLYVAGGAGMATFLINAEPTRFPQISRVENMPAFNAGAGAMVFLSPALSLRFDVRQFALYPPKDSPQLSPDGSGRTLWMQRAAIGLTYGHQPHVVHEERRDPFDHGW